MMNAGSRPEDCPVCATTKPVNAFAAGAYRMYRCTACRTAFVYPQPTAEFLEEFYAQFHASSDTGGTYDAFEGRAAADFESKIDQLYSKGVRQGARLLDVGCGKGYFVRACEKRGLDASGVDLSSTAIRTAQDVLGVRAYCGRIEDLGVDIGKFDVVTFWATIEHVKDPIETLRSIRGLLRPNGLLFLDTGIGDDFTDRMLPGVNQWYDPPQHLWVFSSNGLAKVLDAAGFELLSLDACFERTRARKIVRMLRNGTTAAALGTIGKLMRLRSVPFEGTKFPLGNLMLAVGRIHA